MNLVKYISRDRYMSKVLSVFAIGMLCCVACLGAFSVGGFDVSTTGKSNDVLLVESGVLTGCSHCWMAHDALRELTDESSFEFVYVSMVCDQNTLATERMYDDYNVGPMPTSFFDGGFGVVESSTADSVEQVKSEYESVFSDASSRSRMDIDVSVDASWLGDSSIDVEYVVENNDNTCYGGHLRVYVVEVVSSQGWLDIHGVPYTHAFLDYVFDVDLTVGVGGSVSDSVVWDGYAEFPDLVQHNVMVIAAVFNDVPNTNYAYPPDLNPFDAFYVDAVDSIQLMSNTPPSRPTISGSASGEVDVPYSFDVSSTDPNGDDLFFVVDWGDGSDLEQFGPFDSGSLETISHSWSSAGSFDVRVMARDEFLAEGAWSDPFEFSIAGPEIEIGPLSGSFGKLSFDLENVGSGDAESVAWSLDLSAGLLFVDGSASGTLQSLGEGNSISRSSNFIVGFGSGTAHIEVSGPSIPSVESDQSFSMLLFFISA